MYQDLLVCLVMVKEGGQGPVAVVVLVGPQLVKGHDVFVVCLVEAVGRLHVTLFGTGDLVVSLAWRKLLGD